MHVLDSRVWGQIEKGELNAISMYGSGTRDETVIEIDIPDDGIIKGDTHDFASHRHQFFIQFNADGKMVKGETDEVDGHKHVIKNGTLTEPAAGHAHRYSVSDALAGYIAKTGEKS